MLSSRHNSKGNQTSLVPVFTELCLWFKKNGEKIIAFVESWGCKL